MGFPPPPDLPSPAIQDAAALAASFALSPPAIALCGFVLPLPPLAFGLALPFPPPLPKIPTIKLGIGLNCSLDNPLNITAGIDFGGGRVPQGDPDPDIEF